jgi:hypothetical protein
MVLCVEHPLTLSIIPILIVVLINSKVPLLNMIVISKHVFDLLHSKIFHFLSDGIRHHQPQDLQNRM